jgi:NAD(P)-dependent dehydrogenase (short-subunit alcohol dehydrogenase family)
LEGKVIIITGAAQGLGRAFALKMADEGAKVVAVTDRNVTGIEETARMIVDRGGVAFALKASVADEADTKRMVDETMTKYGRVDILINNAAIFYRKSFLELDPDEWDKVMLVNVKGPWLCARAVFPVMKAQGGGKIINLMSEVFFTGSHGFTHYVTSKGGVVGLTRSLARELGEYNICINNLAPGFTDTEGARDLNPNWEEYDLGPNCIKKLGTPEDMLGAAVFLSSDDSNFITGQTILINGGRHMI